MDDINSIAQATLGEGTDINQIAAATLGDSDPQQKLAQATDYYKRNADDFWGPGSKAYGEARIPGVAEQQAIEHSNRVKESARAMQEGWAKDEHIYTLAQDQARKEYEAGRHGWDKALDLATSLPKVGAEYYLGGKLAQAIPGMAGANFVQTEAAKAAFMPSTYEDIANRYASGDGMTASTFKGALAGTINNVAMAAAGTFLPKVAGAGVGGYIKGTGYSAVKAVGGAQAAKEGLYQTALAGDPSEIHKIISGPDRIQAMKDLAPEILVFGTLEAFMHGAPIMAEHIADLKKEGIDPASPKGQQQIAQTIDQLRQEAKATPAAESTDAFKKAFGVEMPKAPPAAPGVKQFGTEAEMNKYIRESGLKGSTSRTTTTIDGKTQEVHEFRPYTHGAENDPSGTGAYGNRNATGTQRGAESSNQGGNAEAPNRSGPNVRPSAGEEVAGNTGTSRLTPREAATALEADLRQAQAQLLDAKKTEARERGNKEMGIGHANDQATSIRKDLEARVKTLQRQTDEARVAASTAEAPTNAPEAPPSPPGERPTETPSPTVEKPVGPSQDEIRATHRGLVEQRQKAIDAGDFDAELATGKQITSLIKDNPWLKENSVYSKPRPAVPDTAFMGEQTPQQKADRLNTQLQEARHRLDVAKVEESQADATTKTEAKKARKGWADRVKTLQEKVDAAQKEAGPRLPELTPDQLASRPWELKGPPEPPASPPEQTPSKPKSYMERMRERQAERAAGLKAKSDQRPVRTAKDFTTYKPPTDYEKFGVTKVEAFAYDALLGGEDATELGKKGIMGLNSKQAVHQAAERASRKLGNIDPDTGKAKSATRIVAERSLERSGSNPDGTAKPVVDNKEAVDNLIEELARQGTYITEGEAKQQLRASADHLENKENAHQALWLEYFQEAKKNGREFTPEEYAKLDEIAVAGKDPPPNAGKKYAAKQRRKARQGDRPGGQEPIGGGGLREDPQSRPEQVQQGPSAESGPVDQPERPTPTIDQSASRTIDSPTPAGGAFRRAIEGFAADEAGSLDLDKVKEFYGKAKDSFLSGVRSFSLAARNVGHEMFPATHDESQEVGNKMSTYATSRHQAERSKPYFIDKVLGEHVTEHQAKTWWTTLQESRLRYAEAEATARGDVEAAKRASRSFIGQPGSALPDQATYLATLKDPDFLKAVDNYKTDFVPIAEQFYKEATGLDPADSIDSLTQIPGLPVPFKAIREGDKGGTPLGSSQGSLAAPKLRKLGASREAKFSAEKYEDDFREMLGHIIDSRIETANKHEMFRTAVAEGQAQWAVPGPERITTEDGMVLRKMPDVNPPKGTQENAKGQTSLYVNEKIFEEMKNALNMNEPGSATRLVRKVADKINAANLLVSTGEFLYHGTNQATMFFTKPGMRYSDLFSNIKARYENNTEFKAKMKDIARLGADKPSYSEKGNDSILKLGSKMLDGLSDVMRATAHDAYQRLAKEARAGNVQFDDSPQAERNFINQLGKYERRSQAGLIQWLRDSGIGPFATAGSNYAEQSIRALGLDPGIKGQGIYSKLYLRANFLKNITIAAGTVAAMNYFRWGRVDGDDKTPFGNIKLYEKADGSSVSIDTSAPFLIKRALRTTGLLSMIEGQRGATPTGTNIDKAKDDILHAFLHPTMGPAAQAALIAAKGYNTIGMQVAEKPEPGQSEIPKNLKAAALNLNPIVAAATGTARPNDQRSALERFGDLAGPYAPKVRKTPVGNRRK